MYCQTLKSADTLRIMTQLAGQMAEIRGRKGALAGDSKQRVLAAIESLRRVVLKSWATPDTRQKTPE